MAVIDKYPYPDLGKLAPSDPTPEPIGEPSVSVIDVETNQSIQPIHRLVVNVGVSSNGQALLPNLAMISAVVPIDPDNPTSINSFEEDEIIVNPSDSWADITQYRTGSGSIALPSIAISGDAESSTFEGLTLVGYYQFENTSWLNSLGTSALTQVNTVNSVSGITGNAASFSTSSSALFRDDSAFSLNNGDWLIQFYWRYEDAFINDRVILRINPDMIVYTTVSSGNRITAAINDKATGIVTSDPISINTWHLITVHRKGTVLYLDVNGTEKYAAIEETPLVTTTPRLHLNRSEFQSGIASSLIDELRIYTGALTVGNTITGSGGFNIPSIALSGSGSIVTPNFITSSGDLIIPALTLSGSSLVIGGVSGSSSIAVPSLTISGSGTRASGGGGLPLFAHWKFETTSWTEEVSSLTLSQTGTVNSVSGFSGNAAQTTSTTSHLFRDSITVNAGNWKVEFYLRFSSFVSGRGITAIDDDNTGAEFEILTTSSSGNRLIAYVFNTSGVTSSVTSSVTLSTNTWYLVTLERNSANLALSIDSNTANATITGTPYVSELTPRLFIGKSRFNSALPALIDEYKIYK